MKIIIEKETLNESLNIVSKALSTKSIIPILCCIKFEATENGIDLTATNEDITIKTFIDKSKIKEMVDFETVIIPGKYFIEIIRKLEEKYITIETDGFKIIISTSNGEYTLNGMDPIDFPNIKLEMIQNPITIHKDILINLVNQTSFAISTQESRPVLTGINLKISDDILECTATDSYRLAKKTTKLNQKVENNVNIVIPGKNLIELVRLFNQDDNLIELHIFQNNIIFKTNNMIFLSRLLNGTYPDTSKLIPNEFLLTLSLNLMEFYNMLDRVSLLTNEKEKNSIKLEVLDNTIILSSISQEIGKIEEKININKDSDVNMKIAFSPKYMMDAIKSLKSDDIEIKLNGEIKPIIIKEKNDDTLIQLVVPIKTF